MIGTPAVRQSSRAAASVLPSILATPAAASAVPAAVLPGTLIASLVKMEPPSRNTRGRKRKAEAEGGFGMMLNGAGEHDRPECQQSFCRQRCC